MSIQVKHRRDTAANLATFTPAQGELVVDTTYSRVIVGDGSTANGFAAAKLGEVVTNTRTAVANTNYSALGSDRTIAYTSLTAARIVTLPAASAFPTGTRLLILDESGTCSPTFTITLARAGSDTIDGATSYVVSSAYGYVGVTSNGSNKWTAVDQGQLPSSVISGLAASATTDTTNAGNIGSGTLPAGRLPALTGDVTTTAGTVATTIAANAVTNAKAAQMAALTIKGNAGGSTANAADLTVAQVLGMVSPLAINVVLRAVNLNATGDTSLAVPLPSGFARYQVLYASYLNGSITTIGTAKFGLYTASSQGGVAIVSQTALSLTNNTAGALGSMNLVTTNNPNRAFYTATTLYLNIGTVQGAAATCDFVLTIMPLS